MAANRTTDDPAPDDIVTEEEAAADRGVPMSLAEAAYSVRVRGEIVAGAPAAVRSADGALQQQLLPCPFCGKAPIVVPDDSYFGCGVSCSCDAEPGVYYVHGELADAIAAWNRRAPLPVEAADVEVGSDRAVVEGAVVDTEALYEQVISELAKYRPLTMEGIVKAVAALAAAVPVHARGRCTDRERGTMTDWQPNAVPSPYPESRVAALEAELVRLQAVLDETRKALDFYMRGHPCRATNECPSKNAAKLALERGVMEVGRHGQAIEAGALNTKGPATAAPAQPETPNE